MFVCQFPQKDVCKSSLGCDACQWAWSEEQERLEEEQEKSKLGDSLFEIS